MARLAARQLREQLLDVVELPGQLFELSAIRFLQLVDDHVEPDLDLGVLRLCLGLLVLRIFDEACDCLPGTCCC